MLARLIAYLAALLIAISPADALVGPRRALLSAHHAAVVGAAPTLDGTSNNHQTVSGTCPCTITTTLSTTKTNDIIVVFFEYNTPMALTGISDAAGLTWHTRESLGAGVNPYLEFWALSTGILTSDVITLTFSTSGQFAGISAFGVNGANTSSPYDPNVSLPATNTAANASGISTTNAFTLIIASTRCGSSAPTVSGSWTAITSGVAGSFQVTGYQQATTPQSSLSFSNSCSGVNGSIGDALTQ